MLGSSEGGRITDGWSSIIGIVTAIVGNILISIALNTQRLAHVLIEKEQLRRDEAQSHTRRNGANGANGVEYGTSQEQLAEERAKKNTASRVTSNNIEEPDDEEATETDALIPRIHKSSTAKDAEAGSIEDGEKGDDDAPGARKSYLRSPYWWIGIVLMVVGEAGNFLAYGFAPASIVSPLGVVALISNCLVAPIMLHEKFRRRDLLGVVIAVGGAVTVVLSARGSNPKLGPDEIWDLVKRWEFLTYLGITAVFIVILMIASNKFGEKTIIIDLGLVGLFGGYTALSTKGVASLLSYRLWLTLTFPITYVLVAVLVGTAVLQIKYVNRALQRFDSTEVIPTQFVMFTIFVIVGSAVLYRDFEKTTGAKVGQFVGGCALTFLGVWCLTSGRRNGDDTPTAHEQPDEEAGITLVDDESSSRTVTPKPGTTAASSLEHTATPPRLTTTTSSPQLPSAASAASRSEFSLLSTTPSHKSTTSTLHAPSPASRSLSEIPQAPSTPRRHLNQRASLNGLFSVSPGPFTSPLSSGLSVVVADQRGRLRRNSSVRASVAAQASARAAQADAGGALRPAPDQARLSERPRAGRGTSVDVVGGYGEEAAETLDSSRSTSTSGKRRT